MKRTFEKMATCEPTVTAVFLMLAVTIGQAALQDISQCVYDEEVCGCRTDKGVISLKHFGSSSLMTVTSPGGGTFIWNPCRDFKKDAKTAACIQHFDPTMDYDCGTHKTIQSSVADGKAMFQMKSADGVRQSQVTCLCGEGDKLEFIIEKPTGTYNLELVSQHCCPASGGSAGGPSPGSILLIIVLVAVCVYIIAGVIVQGPIRKAQGKERIPNVHFWTAIPGLIKDGIRFTASCGKSVGYGQI